MKKFWVTGLLYASISLSAWADFTWPEEPTTVRIDGQVVEATWRDGRPYVWRDATVALLHIRSGPDYVDLAQVMAERGYHLTLNSDGTIDCRKPQAVASESQAWGKPMEPVPTGTLPTGTVGNGRFSRSRHSPDRKLNMANQPATRHTPARTRSTVATYSAQVDAIGQEVAKFSRRPIAWTFTVVEDRDANAWTPGEGRVFITTGLLDLGLSKDEIAGVLGHEVAHGARQHLDQGRLQVAREDKTDQELRAASARYQQAQQDYQRAMAREGEGSLGASMAKDKLDWETSIARQRANSLKKQYKSHDSYREHETVFSHTHEREADSVGLGYSIAAGYRADGLLTALQKLQASTFKRYGSKAVAGSKTHPPLPERISRLQEVMRQLGY